MRKQMKKMATFALVAGLSVVSATTAFAGQWKQDSIGWWWQEDDGSYPVSTWKEIDGKMYHFDANGYMETGWNKYPTTRRNYNWDGSSYTLYTSDEWYCLLPSGEMLTAGNWDGGCLGEDGSLYIDRTFYDEDLYYQREYSDLPAFIGTPKEYLGASGLYYCSMPWKDELADYIYENTGDGIKTYNLEFQLPATWEQDCPSPLLPKVISASAKPHIQYLNERFSFTWDVDDNFVLHISLERYLQ